MKILIGVDHLIERNASIRALEVLLNLYQSDEIEIICLSHQLGNIGVPIESHRIYSTYLSSLAKTTKSLAQKAFLAPQALKTVKLKTKPDIFIGLSSGLIHLNLDFLPQTTTRMIYLLEENGYLNFKLPRYLKWIPSYLRKMHEKSLLDTSIKWSCAFSGMLPANLVGQEVTPVFQSDPFSFIRDNDFSFNYLWVTILADENTALNTLKMWLKRINDFSSSKLELNAVILHQNPRTLSGNLASESYKVLDKNSFAHFVNYSYFTVDLTGHHFPYMPLASLALGRPCLQPSPAVTLSEYGIYQYFDLNNYDLSLLFDEVQKLDRAKMRRVSLRYNGRIFKAQIKNLVDQYLV